VTKFAAYVARILLCKSCKFGEKNCYSNWDNEFYQRDCFYWRTLYRGLAKKRSHYVWLSTYSKCLNRFAWFSVYVNSVLFWTHLWNLYWTNLYNKWCHIAINSTTWFFTSKTKWGHGIQMPISLTILHAPICTIFGIIPQRDILKMLVYFILINCLIWHGATWQKTITRY